MDPPEVMERHGGIGVFYQAMPAVGADGRNIMKLIPVQKVNGHFVQSETNSTRQSNNMPQRPITLNYSTASVQIRDTGLFNPLGNGQLLKQRLSVGRGSPNKGGETRICTDSASSILRKAPEIPSSTQTCERSAAAKNQLQVTVKSPVLPNGQYLQIPPNAKVRTLHASELPPAIKKQIFTSSANSPPNSGSPTVLYVSPVETMNQSTTLPSSQSKPPPHSLKMPATSSDQINVGLSSTELRSGARAVEKVSQSSNGPFKWVIEEEGSLGPCLVPANSPVITSEILKAVAERENASKHCEKNKNKTPIPQQSPLKPKQGKDNALVMFNGKVYFVGKKRDLPFKLDSNKTTGIDEGSSGPSQLSNMSVACQIQNARQVPSQIVIPDRSDEVIDLCDDDSQGDACQQTGEQPDEDNVIFVSYIPPKSTPESGEHRKIMAQVNEVAASKQNVQPVVDQETVRDEGNVSGPKVVKIWGNANTLSTESYQNTGGGHCCQSNENLDSTGENAACQALETGQTELISADKSSASTPGLQTKNLESDNNQRTNIKLSASCQQADNMCMYPADQKIKKSQPDVSTQDNTCELQHGAGVGNIQNCNSQMISQQMEVTQRIESMDANSTDKDEKNESGPGTLIEKEIEDDNSTEQEGKSEIGPGEQVETEPLTCKTSINLLPDQAPSVQISSRTSDHMLRKMFGISSDVKICLKRMSSSSSDFVPEAPQKIQAASGSTSEEINTFGQESKSMMNKGDEPQPSQKDNGGSCLVTLENTVHQPVQSACRDPADHLITHSLQVDVGPPNKPHPEHQAKPLCPSPQKDSKSPQSNPKETQNATDYPYISSYEEPVDEDWISAANENDIPNSQDKSGDQQTQSSGVDCLLGVCCTDLNKTPKRRGRKRKCTMCPCGMPGTPVKISIKTPVTKQRGKNTPKQTRHGKAIAERKSGKVNKGMHSATAEASETCKEQTQVEEIQSSLTRREHNVRTPRNIPVNVDLSTTSMDCEEIKRDEEIQRLLSILKEKEAALEKIKNGMG